MNKSLNKPRLYSFRRCPYAMRARMALSASKADFEHREILLRDKPAAMLAASPKGTVPVLDFGDHVLEESFDIMVWALDKNDPEGWMPKDENERQAQYDFIQSVEDDFKHHLDRYKYENRYEAEGAVALEHRAKAYQFLEGLEKILTETKQLFGNEISLADIATFPFIRQFANTDRKWFNAQPLPHLQAWLDGHLVSDHFESIMQKHDLWVEK